MRKTVWTLLFAVWAICAYAQTEDTTVTTPTASEDLLGELNDLSAPPPIDKKKIKVYNTFGGTHIINGQSTETISKKTMSFIISHRFGTVNSGWRDFFGLDYASMRMSFEYGILDNLTIGFGRSTFEKAYDGYVKYRFLDQHEKGIPLTMALYADVAINSQKWSDPSRKNYFTSRMSYAFQLMIARKFNDWFSFQITPTVTHYNLVKNNADPNTVFSLGLGAKVKLTKRMSFLAEYYPRIKDNKQNGYKDAFAIGLDVVTGGHVFQFQITNAQAMYESGFIRRTTDNFWKGAIHIGFNISRTWGVGKQAKAERKEKKAKKKASKEVKQS